MAMARDGLLPSFFSDINKHTKVPVKSTIVTGLSAAALAFFMDIEQLAGMVSVGTLLAFTTVAISILILRYVPPDEVRFPSHSVSVLTSRIIQKTDREKPENPVGSSKHSFDNEGSLLGHSVIEKKGSSRICQLNAFMWFNINFAAEHSELRRRKIASCNITLVCIGALVLASAATAKDLPSIPRYISCGLGVVLLLCGLIGLTSIDQDDAVHSFGHPGGFTCPLVPLLPVSCILINTYLLINLGGGTWIRASIWLVAGALIYILYGWSHSSLSDPIYVPIAAHAEEICQTSRHHVP
ncbi:hypothetical protein U1Q18_014389 [Sarracenia purpurea var. burkii]